MLESLLAAGEAAAANVLTEEAAARRATARWGAATWTKRKTCRDSIVAVWRGIGGGGVAEERVEGKRRGKKLG